MNIDIDIKLEFLFPSNVHPRIHHPMVMVCMFLEQLGHSHLDGYSEPVVQFLDTFRHFCINMRYTARNHTGYNPVEQTEKLYNKNIYR